MANAAAAALLQLSHHGRAWDLVRLHYGSCGVPSLARHALHHSMGLVANPAQLSAPLHCQHGGLDDGGDRPTAVADLWADAHLPRLLGACIRREQPLHLAWVSRHVLDTRG